MSEQPLSRRARRARDRQQPEWLADMPEGLSDEEKAAYEEEMAAAARRDRTRTANRSRRAADSPVDAIRTPGQDQDTDAGQESDPGQAEQAETELVPEVEPAAQKPADATVLQSLIPPAQDSPVQQDEPAPLTQGQQLLPVEEFSATDEDPLIHDADLAGLVSEEDVAELTEETDAEDELVSGQLELDLSVEDALAQRNRTPSEAVPGLATSTNLFASAIDPALLAEQSRLAEIADTITSRVQIAGGEPGPTEELAAHRSEMTGNVPVIEADEHTADTETETADEDLEIDLSPLEELQRGTDPENLPQQQEPGREFDTSTLSHSAIIPAVAADLDGEPNRLTELTEEPSFDEVIGPEASEEAAAAERDPSYAAEHPVEAQRAHGLEPQEQSTGFDFGLVSTSSLIVAGIGLLALIVAIVLFIVN